MYGRIVVVLALLCTGAQADDARVAPGAAFVDYVYTFSPENPGGQFGSVQQHTGTEELDAFAAIRITPWLRLVPLIGFSELSFHTGGQNPIDQGQLVLGAGGQVFVRRSGWEARAGLWLREPIPFGRGFSSFTNTSNAQLHGGATAALLVGGARRLGPIGAWFDLGYTHSLTHVTMSEFGLSETFGGFTISAGLSLW